VLALIRRYALIASLAVYVAILISLHWAGCFPAPGAQDVSRLIGVPSVELEGRIIDFPTIRWNQTRFLFEGKAFPGNRYHGRVAVTLSFPRPDLGPGDRLRLRGWLSTPRPASRWHPFDAQRYWAGFNTFALLKVWSEEQCRRTKPVPSLDLSSLAWRFQKRFRSYWEQRLPPEEAGVLLGLTIGGRGCLSAELKDACIRAGVYHIMVVSGQNVAVIILFALAGLRLLNVPARSHVWICLVPLVFYARVTGAGPPVLRAVVTALAGLTVLALHRDVPRFYPFGIAAGWILITDPAALFGASFQLSFGATACLLAVIPYFKRMAGVRPALLRWVLEAGVMSLSVTIGIWPVFVYYFHRFSLMGLAANGVIFPLSEVLMVLGLGIGIIGIGVPAIIPQGLERLIFMLTHWMMEGILWLSRPSWAVVAAEPLRPWVFGMYYSLLFGILLAFHRRKKHAQKNIPVSTRRARL
jgi:competence protein ComEC